MLATFTGGAAIVPRAQGRAERDRAQRAGRLTAPTAAVAAARRRAPRPAAPAAPAARALRHARVTSPPCRRAWGRSSASSRSYDVIVLTIPPRRGETSRSCDIFRATIPSLSRGDIKCKITANVYDAPRLTRVTSQRPGRRARTRYGQIRCRSYDVITLCEPREH